MKDPSSLGDFGFRQS